MIGVGTISDMHTGQVKEALEKIEIPNQELVNRMVQEPRRLVKRHRKSNLPLIWTTTLRLLGPKKYDLGGGSIPKTQGISIQSI
jgi:UDP-N-acetyl-D-mannosaminuronic acid transferase (WecB/TagA/CpsF family)